jgi:putative tricarboxylic transport membrane protein
MSDRIAGGIILALAIWFWTAAGAFTASLSDPLGAAFFPRIISFPLGILALYLVFRPDEEPGWTTGRPLLLQVIVLAILVVYSLSLEALGFPLATFGAVTLLGRIYGLNWKFAVLTAAVSSASFMILFDQILGLPLPGWPNLSG